MKNEHVTKEDVKKLVSASAKEILEAIHLFSKSVDKQFESIDKRFDNVNNRFEHLEIDTQELKTNVNQLKIDIKDIKNNFVTKEYLEGRLQAFLPAQI